MDRENLRDLFPMGAFLPTFSLPSASGGAVGNEYLIGGKFGLVVFSCNHCPYVKKSEGELLSIVKEFGSMGLKIVAINSNDALQYPEDSFEEMMKVAKRLPFPYLYDESQEVAKAFDAACTPECYLFDHMEKLVYHGSVVHAPGSSVDANSHPLRKALLQGFSGENISPENVRAIGCSIKWKKGKS